MWTAPAVLLEMPSASTRMSAAMMTLRVLGEVDAVLNDVAHADGGDHTVEDHGHAADGGGGHCGDEGCELRAEAEDYREERREADDAGHEMESASTVFSP